MDNTQLALLEFHWSYIRDTKKKKKKKKRVIFKGTFLPPPNLLLSITNYKNRKAFMKCFLTQIE